MSQALAVQESSLDIVMSADLKKIQEQLQAISNFQNVVQTTLVKDQDYGIIPGTNKPTLLKPGAEKIIMLMGLTSTYEIVEKVEDYEKGFFAYTIKSSLLKGNQLITEGFGSANTRESRYKLKDNKGWQDAYTLVNTVLKMAKKRAQVDAVLTVASLSNIFTQDMEDLPNLNVVSSSKNNNPNEITVTFGKHKGKTLKQLYVEDKGYVKWLSTDAKDETVKIAALKLMTDGIIIKESTDVKQDVLEQLTDSQLKQIERLAQQYLNETGEDIIQTWQATEYKTFTKQEADKFITIANQKLLELQEQKSDNEQSQLFDTRNPNKELVGASVSISDDNLPF